MPVQGFIAVVIGSVGGLMKEVYTAPCTYTCFLPRLIKFSQAFLTILIPCRPQRRLQTQH